MSMCRLSPSRKVNQGGVTLIGLLFWSILLCSAALVFMRVAPAVGEYRTILSMVKKVAHEGGGTVAEIRAAYNRAQQIEYGVSAVTAQDLEITKENDRVIVKFAYDKEIELISPVFLVIKFKGQSN
jgi:hypothetical protein